ncbi:MAG: hypothetical protein GY943_38470 [Chloroflexi bacterium]|nr:hypothetical protein [Chloroflexota bacterium]
MSAEVMPQEGPNVLKGVPYEELAVGTYLPGQVVEGSPHLTRALAEFEAAMERHGCTTIGDDRFETCEVEGPGRWRNNFTTNAMPDPYAELRIEQVQESMVQLSLFFQVFDPDTGDELINTITTDWRHEDSFYEEECRFVNKDC